MRFTLLYVEKLTSTVSERITSFVSSRDVGHSGMELHCVQCDQSALYPGPWLQGKLWDEETIELELTKLSVRDSTWKRLLLDREHLDCVIAVTSEVPGSGKSKYIRDEMDKLKASSGSEVASIVIHEKTSYSSLVADARRKFSNRRQGPMAVHFSFCSLPTSNSENASKWFESLNSFFFSLLVLRYVFDEDEGVPFHLGKRRWNIFVELPATTTKKSSQLLLEERLPIISFCGSIRGPPSAFAIDKPTRRVCTYLRAYKDGTINRKFNSTPVVRTILFVLDWSGSMHSTPLNAAVDNALRLFDSHVQVGDTFGLTMFDHAPYVAWPSHKIERAEELDQIRRTIDSMRTGGGGGTRMYDAILRTIPAQVEEDTWLVCLTDGASDGSSEHQLQTYLRNSPPMLRIIVVGINMNQSLEAKMIALCGKYSGCDSGLLIPSGGSLDELNQAFAIVARRIPVSQTFELFDGIVSDEHCRQLLKEFTGSFLKEEEKLLLSAWVQFLYRRVSVFDKNSEFNENVSHDRLGSTLMKTMLEEVKRLLSTEQDLEWAAQNHSQLVYDFTNPNSPQFRLVCTAPQLLENSVRREYELLELPGFSIPSSEELNQRGTLDRFLSQAMNIPLTTMSSGDLRLKCIEDSGFVLTLDFTMKLLNIHERVSCNLPCVIEGETGVSKTALTNMYAILRNASVQSEATESANSTLAEVEQELAKDGIPLGNGKTTLSRLEDVLASAAKRSIGDETEEAGRLFTLLRAKQENRSVVFRSPPDEFCMTKNSKTESVRAFLQWFSQANLESLFYDLNVDASLSESDIVDAFEKARQVAKRLLGTGALVVVFLDGM